MHYQLKDIVTDDEWDEFKIKVIKERPKKTIKEMFEKFIKDYIKED